MNTKTVEFNGETLTVLSETDLLLFKILDDTEKETFKQWANNNLDAPVASTWHPIIQDILIKHQE